LQDSDQESNGEPPESDSDSDDDELAMAPNLYLSIQNKIKVLLLLATKRRHGLSYSAAESVMELAGVLSDNQKEPLLVSKHLMKTAINMYSFDIQEHHVCPHCELYIGMIPDSVNSTECSSCNNEIDVKQNRKDGHMFLYLSVYEQLKALFENAIDPDNDLIHLDQRQKIKLFNIEDIHDGKCYERIRPGYLSFNFFIDGLQVTIGSTVCYQYFFYRHFFFFFNFIT
jgi:hypothetical protein